MVILRRWIFVAALFAGGSGCAVKMHLNLQPGACVNPQEGSCPLDANAASSRILELRFYQLKQSIAPCQLDWNAFAANKDMDLLRSALATSVSVDLESQRVDAVRRIEKVAPNESRKLSPWRLMSSTRFILMVAIGRNRGKNSIRLIPISRLRRDLVLHIHGYDLCLDQPCDLNMELECP